MRSGLAFVSGWLLLGRIGLARGFSHSGSLAAIAANCYAWNKMIKDIGWIEIRGETMRRTLIAIVSVLMLALVHGAAISPASAQTIPKSLQEGGTENAIKQRKNN